MKKFAFTLAEVLLVIGVIGIVAAITIPTLNQNVKDREVVATLKQTYITLESAYQNVLTKQEKPVQKLNYPSTPTDYTQNIPYFSNLLVNELKINKNCGFKNELNTNCMTGTAVNGLFKTPVKAIAPASFYTFMIDDVSVSVGMTNTNCTSMSSITFQNICGNIYIDVDGPNKGDFTYGKDVFILRITPEKLVPAGELVDRQYAFYKPIIAGVVGVVNNDNCLHGAGLGCAAWVIVNNNRDYLKCKNIEWNSNRSCQ